MAALKHPPGVYNFRDPPSPQQRKKPHTPSGTKRKKRPTPLAQRFRVPSSPHQSRRITRKSAMPLAFDDKHLKKLLDHYCTAERLGSWVQSAPVVAILKYWVKCTLKCPEHDHIYRSLLLPAESEEKWSDFEEDCVHVAFTRIKGEALGEPAPDPPTSAWAYAIEQLVRDSWRDVGSGPLNGGQNPAQFKLDGWPCERACDLLHTVYESLRNEPNSGYFANLLGTFTGQRYLPLPVQSRPQPKPACETCRFNHIACDRAEPVCGQCKHKKVLCTKAGEVTSDTTTGDDEEVPSYPFDPLFDESPPQSEPLMEPASRLAPPISTPQSETSFFLRAEPTTATRPRLLDFAFQPSFSTTGFSTTGFSTTSVSSTGGPAPSPNTPACGTCRARHRGCDRVRPSCGECSLRSVDCVWDRDGAAKTLSGSSFDSKKLTKPPGANGTALEEGEIDEDIDIDKSPRKSSSGSKRVLGGYLPSPKRPRPSSSTLMEALLSSVPRAIGTQPVNRAPTAPMMAPLPTTPPRPLGKVHSDRLAQIGQPSPEKASSLAENIAPATGFRRSGSNSIEVSATRVSSVKTENKEVPNGFAKPQTRTVPPLFSAQSSTPFSGAVQTGINLTKKQRKKAAGGPILPPNRPNTAAPVALPSLEETRLSGALHYCKTLFDDIIAGRNVPNAAQLGVTAIQHALGNN